CKTARPRRPHVRHPEPAGEDQEPGRGGQPPSCYPRQRVNFKALGRWLMRLVQIPVAPPPRPPEAMEEILAAVLGDIPVEFGRSATELIATVPSERLYETAFRLKHDDRTHMNYLRC